MYVITIHQRDRQTETDGRTTFSYRYRATHVGASCGKNPEDTKVKRYCRE